MMNARITVIKNQTIIGLSVLVVGVWLAWQIAVRIAAGDLNSLGFLALGFASLSAAITILRNWRLGFYLFVVWLLFEDFFRKFLGNNMEIYFAKDVLAGLTYLSFYLDLRRRKDRLFRPTFLMPLFLFIWLAAVQVFNTNSPSILYGLMGIKIYFYYIPMMYLGYAIVRNDEELRRFLVLNVVLGGVICSVGIAQAILGNSFLNPAVLAPELQELGNLDKVTPLSNEIFSLPPSVFVSTGRFAQYLILASILIMGTVGFLLLYSKRSRKLSYFVFAIIGVAVLFSGSRSAVMYCAISALVIVAGFLWGAPWRAGQGHLLIKAIRRTLVGAALGLATVVFLFPQEVTPRLNFYTETLSPSSSAYAGTARGWDYPMYNFQLAFTNPNWVWGNGTGTGSLGTQYVAKILGTGVPDTSVEEGYGDLILEMGILAPLLWISWTTVLLVSMWKVLRRLRQTRHFPIAFVIFWYALLLLVLLTYMGMATYQNYVSNAYLWLLVGIFFRLPMLQPAQVVWPAVAVPNQTVPRRFS
jgi:hypothetical protein